MTTSTPSDGWITLPGADGVTVHVRARWRGSGVRITDLYLHTGADDGLTPASMRCVSISRLEAELRLILRPGAMLASDGPTLLEIYSNALPGDNNPTEPSVAELRARTPLARQPTPRARLTRPHGDPGSFYPLVALAYSEYAPHTSAPAKAIASEASVPLTTAQRWIAEARRRGFLPPARKGKAG